MSGRWRITIEDQGSVCKVHGWRVKELLLEAGLKPFFAAGGWLVDAERVPDLLAHLDRRHIAVEMTDTGTSTPGPDHDVRDVKDRRDGQRPDAMWPTDLPLWDPSGGDAA